MALDAVAINVHFGNLPVGLLRCMQLCIEQSLFIHLASYDEVHVYEVEVLLMESVFSPRRAELLPCIDT